MSQAPAEAEDLDEDHGHPIPEPPRRVPFGVMITAALLGMLALPLVVLAMVTLFSGSAFSDDVGAATLRGLAAAAVAVCAVLVVAVAWSFVRDGNTVGPMIVGLLVVVTALISMATGVSGDADTEGLRVGVLALVLGLGVLLVPLLGHGPAYLAARRVWSRAERDWLRDLATPEAPPAYGQQWPGQPAPQQQWGAPPQQQQWGAPPQQQYQPGYPAQYQYPPQPGQGWSGQQPQQYQAWPEATAPPWSGQQPAAQPSAQAGATPAPPAQAGTTPAPAAQAGATPAPQAPGEQISVPADPVPLAAAQQAPTEQLRPGDPEPPQHR